MPLIQTTPIDGGAVYGVPQVSYTVEGETDKDYGAALAAAAFQQSIAIEDSASAYADVVRVRARKVSDIGDALAGLNRGVASLRVENAEPGDRTSKMSELYEAYTVAQKYGIEFSWSELDSANGTASMTRAQLYTAQNEFQHALDVEDNNLQQDTVSLQSLLSKRDNAFSTAARLVRKANDAASTTIGNIV